MKPHKDLPPASQPWASEVDTKLAKISELEEVVRRLSENAGLDYSNPKRGINAGATPSVKSPVGQKLASLADVSTYNVADGYVLTWDQKEQRWLPKVKAGSGGPSLPADTWNVPVTKTNLFLDPSFETSVGLQGWQFYQDNNNSYGSMDFTTAVGAGRNGGNAMQADFYYTNPNFASSMIVGNLVGVSGAVRDYVLWVKAVSPSPNTIFINSKTIDASGYGNVQQTSKLSSGEWVEIRVSGYGGVTVDLGIAVDNVPANSATPVRILIDDGYIGASLYGAPTFSGDTPDSADYEYAWTGAQNNSTSVQAVRRKLMVPGTIQQGARVQMLGTGWVPGETVFLGLNGNYLDKTVAGPNGSFDVGMQLPAYIDPSYTPTLSADTESRTFSIYVDVTLV